MIERVVFIGGCERSGTTMAAAMLGGHPACHTTPAAQFLTDYVQLVRRNDGTPQALADCVAAHAEFQRWDIPKPAPPPSLARGAVQEWYLELASRHHSAVGNGGAPRVWVTHSPANIRHVPSLAWLFPDARFVHMVRDGRDVAVSVREMAHGLVTMKQLSSLWQERLSHGLAAELAMPERVLRVRYEDLVCRPAATTRKLAAFADLSPEPRMARGDGFTPRRGNRTGLAGKPPDPRRIGRWRRALSDGEVEAFEYYSAELLPALGYTLETKGSVPSLRWRVWQEAHGFVARTSASILRWR